MKYNSKTRISNVDNGHFGIIEKAIGMGHTSRINDLDKEHKVKMRIYKAFSGYQKTIKRNLPKKCTKLDLNRKEEKEEFKFDNLSKLNRKVIQNIKCPKNSEVVYLKMVTKIDAADMDNDHLFDSGEKYLSNYPV
ncbi:hypothetical protein F8M41_004695 [Gigaspora margarita]|uniref:Uncharacterized protein n=1 Tax=Gigaspora margarita TaxID=4874 RepID=A0A8H4AXI4_GIGMA|nr:hypothetical protein F8M41_004695 [Gigaspora margarita]